jgi:hypothetical protein
VLTAGALGTGALEDASNEPNGFARLEMAPDEKAAGMEAADGNKKEAAGEARPKIEGLGAVDGFTAGVEVKAAENTGIAELVPNKPPPANGVMLGEAAAFVVGMPGEGAGEKNAAAPLAFPKLDTQADVDDPRKLRPKLDGKRAGAMAGAGLDEKKLETKVPPAADAATGGAANVGSAGTVGAGARDRRELRCLAETFEGFVAEGNSCIS